MSNTFDFIKTFNVLEPIPKFFLVTGDPHSQESLRLASSTDVNRLAFGIVVADYPIANTVDVLIITYGVIEYHGWDWDVNLGKELYCGPTGEFVQAIIPSDNAIQKVGTVLGPTTILLDIVPNLLVVS